jgi:vitamin B12 transporter
MRHVILFFVLLSAAFTPAIPEEYLITANRVKEDPAQVTADVTVIDEEEFREKEYNDLDSLLSSLSFFSVAEYGPWGGSSVRLGGSASKNLLVLLDGIPLTNSTGIERGFSLPNFSLAGVNRAEIVRGANSAVYGSNAVTGVVNLITDSGPSPELTLSLARGSYAFFSGEASLSHTFSRTAATVTAEYMTADGYNLSPQGSEKDGASGYTLAAALDGSLSDDVSLTARVRYMNSSLDYDSWSYQAADAPLTEENRTLFAMVRGEGEVFSNHRSLLTLSLNQTRRIYQDNGMETDRYAGSTLRLSLQDDISAGRTTWSLGSDLTFEQARQDTSYDYDMERETMALSEFYTGLFTSLSERFSFDAAARVLLPHTDSSERAIVYKAGVRWNALRVPWKTDLSVNYGTSYNLPTLFQLYGTALDWMTSSPVTVGNRDLKPEQGSNVNIRMENRLFDDSVEFDLFWSREAFRDYITMDYLLNRYENRGKALIDNLEIRSSLAFHPGVWEVRLFGHYLITQARDTTEDPHTDMPMIPESSSLAGLHLSCPKGAAEISLNTVGKRLSGYPVLTMPAYSLLSASLTWNVSDSLSVNLKGDNLTGETYHQTVEIVDSGFGPAPLITGVSGYVHYPGYRTPERSFQLRLTYRLPL